MFEHVPDYPMAVTGIQRRRPYGSQARGGVVEVQATADVGGQPLVYAPNPTEALREWPNLAELDGWAVVTTWKSFGGWSGGPVLAAWPDTEHLAVVIDDSRTRALCVVPWIDSEVAAWVRAYRPVTLPLQAGSCHGRAGDHLRPSRGRRTQDADRPSQRDEPVRQCWR